MKTLIVYATKYGCTKRCAEKLAEKLSCQVELLNLKNGSAADFDLYDTVIIGSPIYMGQIQKEVNQFIIENLDLLKDKKIGIFTCCMREGEMAQQQLEAIFPKELLDMAIAKDYFGGEFSISKMSFMDKFITKMVAKVTVDSSNILELSIDMFAQKINKGEKVAR